MAILVLCEPEYMQTMQCDAKRKGILCEVRRRRIPIRFFTDPVAAKNAAMHGDAACSVILLFDSMQWLQETAAVLSDCDAHFILATDLADIPLPIRYSRVGTDLDAAMETAVRYLRNSGKSRIALLDTSADSCSSRACIAALEKHVPKEEFCIFDSDFDAFFAVHKDFDTVLCTNDLAAAFLCERLKQYPPPFVLSLTNTSMAKFYREGITSIAADDRVCGKMIIQTHFHREKYGFSRTVNLLPAELVVRGSTLPSHATVQQPQPPSAACADTLRRLARMLTSSDLTDLKILYGLLCGYDYDKIHSVFFILPGTTRYRMRRIRTALGVQSKRDVAEILQAYIRTDNLLTILSEAEQELR